MNKYNLICICECKYFVYCIKHETKYNFLFMEYVNLTKIINNIRKTETKRGEQKDTWKHEGRYLKK